MFEYGVDGDGVVDPGDKVYLFFGFARGGSTYYALDVTDKAAPRFLWKRNETHLPGLGKAWSAPTVAHVNIAGATQNAQKFVLICGGGCDEAQENYVYMTDSVGNRIFMLDLESGNLLWYAGNNGGANPQLAEMNNSIPSRVTVLDTHSDKFADIMYVGDMGGRLWRFDIWNGEDVGDLVTGDVTPTVPAGAPGWTLLLNDGGTWLGGKVLAETITVAGVILFPTFIPLRGNPENPCTARMVNRAYAIRVEDGRPAFDEDDDELIETRDRYTEPKQTGIAAEIAVLVNANTESSVGDTGSGDPAEAPPSTTRTTGVEVLARCVEVSSSFRTYWQRQ